MGGALSGIAANTNVTLTATLQTCSSSQAVAAPVCTCPPITSPTLVASATFICQGQSSTLTASGCTQGQLVWQPAGGVASANQYTVSPTLNTTYSVRCQVGSCLSAPSNSLTVSINPTQTATADSTTGCLGTPLTLLARGCSSSYAWFETATSTAVLATTASFSPPLLSQSRSYFVSCAGAGSCAGLRKAVFAGVKPAPLPPMVVLSKGVVCPDSSVTLTATGCPNGVSWAYSASNGSSGTLAGSASSLVLLHSNLQADTTRFTGACLGACGTSSPSLTLLLLRKANCGPVVPPTTADSTCAVYVKAVDGQNIETTTFKRKTVGVGYQPLTLSAASLDGLPIGAASYKWFYKNRQIATTPTINADSLGEYKLILAPLLGAGGATCEASINLNGKPCTVRNYANATCQSISINRPDSTTKLYNLAVGDIFNAADYTVYVTQVAPPLGVGGPWSGKGYLSMLLPTGITSNVAVHFDNILINDCYELSKGKVETDYDPRMKGILDADELVGDLSEVVNVSLANLKTLFSIFEGTCKEVQAISSQIAELEKTLSQDNDNTPTRKQQLQDQLNELKTAFNELKTCSDCNSNQAGRLAAPEDCGTKQKNCLDKVDKLYETLKKIISDGDVLESLEKLYKVYVYVKTTIDVCRQTGWLPQDGGIIPLCIWVAAPATNAFSASDPAFVAGIADGAYVELGELYKGIMEAPNLLRDVEKLIDAHTSAYIICKLTQYERTAAVARLKASKSESYWLQMIEESFARQNQRCEEAQKIRASTKQYLTQFADYVSHVSNIGKLLRSSNIKISKYIVTTLNNPSAEFRYNQGRLLGRSIVFLGSLGVGGGEIKLIGQSLKNGVTALPELFLSSGKKLNLRKFFRAPLLERKEVGQKIKNNPSNNPEQWSEFIDTEANLASREASPILTDLSAGGLTFPTASVNVTLGGTISKAQIVDFGKELLLAPADVARIKTATGSIAAIAEEAVYSKISSVRTNLKKWNTKFHGDADNGLDLVLTENVALSQLKEVIIIDVKSSIVQKVPHSQSLGRGYGGFTQLSDNYLFGVGPRRDGGIVKVMKSEVYLQENVRPTAIMLEYADFHGIPIRKYIIQVDKDGICNLVKID